MLINLCERLPQQRQNLQPLALADVDTTEDAYEERFHACIRANFSSLIDEWKSSIVMFLKTVHRTRLRTGRHLLQGFALAHITNNKLLFAAAYLAAFHQTKQGKIFSDATFLDDLRHELLYAFPPVGSSNTFVMSDWEMAIRFLTIPLELSFGPDSEYHDRMEDLQAMIARRGGLYSPTIPQVIRDFALSCGHDVPMYARIKPFFLPAKLQRLQREFPEVKASCDRIPDPLPDGFRMLWKVHLLQPTIMCCLSDLHTLDLTGADASYVLMWIRERLEVWNPSMFSACYYCPTRSQDEDDVDWYAHEFLRVTLLCIVYRLECRLPSGPSRDPNWLSLELSSFGIGELWRISHSVFFSHFVWMLFVICSTVPSVAPEFYATLAMSVGKFLQTEDTDIEAQMIALRMVSKPYFDLGDDVLAEFVDLWNFVSVKEWQFLQVEVVELWGSEWW